MKFSRRLILFKSIFLITLFFILTSFLSIQAEDLSQRKFENKLTGVLNPTEKEEAKKLFKSWTDNDVVNFFAQSGMKSVEFKKLYDSFLETLIPPGETSQEISSSVDKESLAQLEYLGRIIHNRLLALTKKNQKNYAKLLMLMREIIFLQLKYLPLTADHNFDHYLHWRIVHNGTMQMLNKEYFLFLKSER